MAATKHWSKVDERGSLFGMRFLITVYRILGRYILWIFLFPVVTYFFITGQSANAAIREYFEHLHSVYPNAPKSSFWNRYKLFLIYANSIFDRFDAWLGKIEMSRIEYNDKTIFPAMVSSQKGAIFIGSHLGNLEVCRALAQTYTVVINVLVFTDHAEKFNQVLSEINPDVQTNLYQLANISPEMAIMLKEKLDAGEMIVIVADRTSTTVPGKSFDVEFFGEMAAFPQGPFILASLLDCPVYWIYCLKRDGKFNMVFEYVADSLYVQRKKRIEHLQPVVEQYASRLEFYTRNYPFQWFNFFSFWQPSKALEDRER